ncbi:thioesterase superfamily protein [Sulfobacillus acidophilus TPY]|uniref:Thioesterase superfamily protein n=1 Tax=Sulfobacillus acidophilus (strain ATCC 700253 / DSM 10332 / NAL) TaxID=679936 RepID=G8U0P0_SULAD|nr:thioesterase superfamily protein [Sulfobacillus acidophilus TPY]AEW05343.1 thioesterase superfamily protein [Sulfobacillus acidophilus DSM 10332]MCY0863567.1 thioesterase family protein [Sulfobacillus sp.]
MTLEETDIVMMGETDASGIGHFIGQLRLLERAEFYFMKAIGLPYHADMFDDYLLPRVHLDVDYLDPLHFADQVQYDVTVSRIGRTSFTLAITVRRLPDAVDAMRGAITLVLLDAKTGRPTPLPDPWRRQLARYQTQ